MVGVRGESGGSARPGLRETRRRIEAMAGGGRFAVTVADTGVEPVPVRGLRFPDRESAVVAARLTTAYRASLKRWDPETVLRDQVVRERPVGSDEGGSPSAAPPSTSERAHTGGER